MILIHLTAAYSNAVLVAVLPYVSNFAKTLELPIPTPITANQIEHYSITPWKDNVGCGIWLTNHYLFGFGMGYVGSFQALINNPFNEMGSRDAYPAQVLHRFVGKDSMTTNEAIELARRSFYKLGYTSEDFDIRGPPTRFHGPMSLENIGRVPYCQIEWESPNSKVRNLLDLDYNIQFDMDMQHKQIVGMNLSGKKFWRPDPKIDVVPEVETNYQRAGLAGQFARMLNREPTVHMTPAYSNATLTAILPYVADFGKRLNLPTHQPLTNSQVLLFFPPVYYTNDGFHCIVMLTNQLWFTFLAGFITEFGSTDDWFEEVGTKTNWSIYTSKNCMTTNETIDFARECFRQLGYELKDFHLQSPPTTFENASDGQNRHYAYCRVNWESPDDEQTDIYQVQFDIDMLLKRVVGATLISKKFMRPLPKIDIVPELESDYQKHTNMEMFIRTNAPPYYFPHKLQPGEAPLTAQTNSVSP